MKRIMAPVLLASLLAGCATPETRVRTALTDAGLSKPIATCMADRIVDRLSLIQLNKLSGLKKLRGQNLRTLSVDEFLKRTRSLQDPEILKVVSSSGLICAIDSRSGTK
jgi:type IV pilus biogenesis protein CpaD/CtpE